MNLTRSIPRAASSSSAAAACARRCAVQPRCVVQASARPELQQPSQQRRNVLIGMIATTLLVGSQPSAQAAGFGKKLKKKKLTEEDYKLSEEVGFGIYELEEGSGPAIKAGDDVTVHFDVMYRGVDVVSSRQARLLGGNRTIAEPYEFVVGEAVDAQPVKKISDSAGGLFSGQGGPKPPPALSTACLGMKKGGKRSILVNKPEQGYGEKGILELPPNATFELMVEVLEIKSK